LTPLARKILNAIRAAGGKVVLVERDCLELVSANPLPDALIAAAKAAKAELLEALAEAEPPRAPQANDGQLRTPEDDDEYVEHEERSAIREYAGDMSREWADLLTRLNRVRPQPANVTSREWLSYVDACDKLADWAVHMAELGWSPQAVLGWDGRGDFPYTAHKSLPWLLADGGYTLISLDAHEAVVDTHAGDQRVLRRLVERRELVWMLADN
jgi:hypothetical protein